jgi:hypothetical protein
MVFAVSFFLFYSDLGAQSIDTENHCFTCHTNARKLIKITREIAKENKAEPGVSVETKGEG